MWSFILGWSWFPFIIWGIFLNKVLIKFITDLQALLASWFILLSLLVVFLLKGIPLLERVVYLPIFVEEVPSLLFYFGVNFKFENNNKTKIRIF